ncbi:MAG: hypothetical protein IKM06_04650 [Clostridia bacterium]|nr:hypothetical protein [Clostridia bacterium]
MERSVLEFGALGNGIHDDYPAFQAALDSGGTVIIPQGIYPISQTLRVHFDTTVIAQKGAKMVMKGALKRTRNEFLLSNSDTVNGNKNISIKGGIWDGNNTAPENEKPDLFDKSGYSGAVINFVNVNDLELSDMVLANSVTFYIRISKVHRFKIENIDLVSDTFGANQDGLHFGGDVKHGRVANIRALSYGQTNDDMIALNADDCIERVENLDLCRDNIEDITFENIFTENCHTIIRMLSVTAKIKNLHFKNIYGGFRCNAINADGARYCRTPIFKEEDCPEGVGRISDIYFDDFTCFPVFDLPQDFKGTRTVPQTALLLESHMDNFEIANFNYLCLPENIKKCPAVKARNLVKEKIRWEDGERILNSKENTLLLENFKSLRIDKI